MIHDSDDYVYDEASGEWMSAACRFALRSDPGWA